MAARTQKQLRSDLAKRLAADPNDKSHGNIHGWRAGCRCDACEAAHKRFNEYKNEWDKNKRKAERAAREAKMTEGADGLVPMPKVPRIYTKPRRFMPVPVWRGDGKYYSSESDAARDVGVTVGEIRHAVMHRCKARGWTWYSELPKHCRKPLRHWIMGGRDGH